MDHATYYARLERGARYLASIAANDDERREHLGWANRYHRLGCDAAVPGHCVLVKASARFS